MTETLDQQTTTTNRLTTRSTTFVPPTFSKVTSEHLRQNAVLYVRQSTSQQFRDHQESTQRQYQLTHRLEAFGWHRDQIIVIDEDLGISGSGRQQRPGFRRLLNLVTEQKVGIVLGLEMSRLARNSAWTGRAGYSAIALLRIGSVSGTRYSHTVHLREPYDSNRRTFLLRSGDVRLPR